MSKSKQKGTRFESQVVAYLKDHGYSLAERRAPNGKLDRGDIGGVRGWTLELKNCKQMTLGPWLKEAGRESDNAGTTRYAVVHKQRERGVDESFVTMPLWLFAELARGDAGNA